MAHGQPWQRASCEEAQAVEDTYYCSRTLHCILRAPCCEDAESASLLTYYVQAV